jgi:hypothetical protein
VKEKDDESYNEEKKIISCIGETNGSIREI